MAKLLAIDPATSSGWAYTTGSLKCASSGRWRAKGAEGQPHLLAAKQAVTFAQFLTDHDVEYCLIERPTSRVMKSITTQNALWCLHGSLVAVLVLHGIPYRTCQPNEWRRAVLGNGNLSSEAAKQAAITTSGYLGCPTTNADRAEALCLLAHLKQQHRRWVLEDEVLAA